MPIASSVNIDLIPTQWTVGPQDCGKRLSKHGIAHNGLKDRCEHLTLSKSANIPAWDGLFDAPRRQFKLMAKAMLNEVFLYTRLHLFHTFQRESTSQDDKASLVELGGNFTGDVTQQHQQHKQKWRRHAVRMAKCVGAPLG